MELSCNAVDIIELGGIVPKAVGTHHLVHVFSMKVMSLVPDHIIWKRDRMPHHAGAVRKYPDYDDDEAIPMGPDATPVHCRACEKAGSFSFDVDIQQSPDSGFLYLSSCTDSSTESVEEMDSSSYSKLEVLPTKGTF